jgi:hypothetical protein
MRRFLAESGRRKQPREHVERLHHIKGQLEGDMQRSHLGVLAIASLAIAGASVPCARGLEPFGDLPPFGLAGSHAAGRPRLAVVFVDYSGLSDPMLAAVQAETASLVADLGVEADVDSLPPGAVLEPGAVTVILMNGTAPGHMTKGVMGAVQREGSMRVLWIYSSNVAAAARLTWSKRSRWSGRDRDGFATAMARVAVHEVVHLVCPWRGHDDHGLMAGVVGWETLTGSRVSLAPGLRRDFGLGVDALSGAAFAVAHGEPAPRH